MGLWQLLRTAEEPAALADDLTTAADRAAAALAAAMRGESHLVLQQRSGALVVNGVRLRLHVDEFAAHEGLADRLRRHGVGELLFEAGMQAGALLTLVGCYAGSVAGSDEDPEAILQRHGVVGVHASRLEDPAASTASWCARKHGAEPSDQGSRLRAVFLHHTLVAAHGTAGIVPRHRVHLVLQAVADRLLREPAGLEPLLVLQQDPAGLETAVHVCVLATLIGRAAGCPDGLLAETAVAALCHDVGRLLAPTASAPGATGCRWLLQRGRSGLWLRCGLVARSVGGCAGVPADELPGDGEFAAAVVALAVELDRRLRRCQQPLDAALVAVGGSRGNGSSGAPLARWRAELVAAAAEALAANSTDRGGGPDTVSAAGAAGLVSDPA